MSKHAWIDDLTRDNGFEEYRLKQTDVTPEFKRSAHKLAYYLIEAGPDKEVHSKRLEDHFEVSGSEIRKMIRWLRFDGYPIGSTSRGYFYTRNLEKLDSTIKHILDRAKANAMVALSLRETQDKKNIRSELQETLF